MGIHTFQFFTLCRRVSLNYRSLVAQIFVVTGLIVRKICTNCLAADGMFSYLGLYLLQVNELVSAVHTVKNICKFTDFFNMNFLYFRFSRNFLYLYRQFVFLQQIKCCLTCIFCSFEKPLFSVLKPNFTAMFINICKFTDSFTIFFYFLITQKYIVI